MNYRNIVYVFTLSIAVLVVVLLLTSSHQVYSDDISCINNALFYIFGESTCPYCKLQHDFFQQNYPASSHYFCILDKYTDCYNKFRQFVLEELISKAGVNTQEIGVPLTIVVKDYGEYKSIVAVVIGAITDKNFWQQLACSQPGSNIPVYVGMRQAYWIATNTTDHSSLLEKYIVYPYSTSTNKESGSINSVFITTVAIVILIIVAIGGYMLHGYLKK
ncbi:MAG: hypothetical protein QXJ69_02475 [Desulfurococcaceae archaeon]